MADSPGLPARSICTYLIAGPQLVLHGGDQQASGARAARLAPGAGPQLTPGRLLTKAQYGSDTLASVPQPQGRQVPADHLHLAVQLHLARAASVETLGFETSSFPPRCARRGPRAGWLPTDPPVVGQTDGTRFKRPARAASTLFAHRNPSCGRRPGERHRRPSWDPARAFRNRRQARAPRPLSTSVCCWRPWLLLFGTNSYCLRGWPLSFSRLGRIPLFMGVYELPHKPARARHFLGWRFDGLPYSESDTCRFRAKL